MPQVDLSDSTFARLQRLAIPLVDNIDSVIGRLLDAYGELGSSQMTAAASHDGARSFDPASPPSLTHTKLLSARFGATSVDRGANWNSLLLLAIRTAKAKVATVDELRRFLIVNWVPGKKEDEGYKFVPDLGISIQGQDANAAWRGAFHIAQQLSCPIEVEFVWRNKEGAAFPGEAARMCLA